MLPEGWKEVKLEEAVSFLDGKRKPLKSEDRLKIRGQYPYYGATGIIDYVNDYIFDDTLILMGEDGENIISRNLPHVFIISGKTWVNNHAHVLKAKKYCDTRFLSSYLESLNYEKYNTGSAQPKLNKAICENIRILLPPFPEQKKIAAILSTWDRAIEGTEKLLANSQQQKKALMQQLLTGKKRLPGFTGEWKKKTLSNVCQIKTGKKDVNEGCENGEYPFFTCAKQHTFSENYSYDCEAILIAGNGEVGKTHYYNGKFEAYQRTYILSDFTNISVFFLLHFIEFFLPLDISKEKQHGAMPYIKLGTLKDFSVVTPPIPEQRAIATVLTTADEEIASLESDLSRLRQEKKALMQQLLTGKRRVTVD
ncbi:restriction endonuclease subunit S [Gluconacetobacter sp. Hr-1-5]|uniref:restriction endonuclease subunit S n=1 Tax=Gluconacetobacter sp. Hr-1-5 TaxID=3395370 RepID=UPI003B5255A7